MTASAPLQVWRQHWDMQLYKALEVQFRAGLETINDSLPEVRVRVVVLCARKYNTLTAPPHLTPLLYTNTSPSGLCALIDTGMYGA